MSQLFQLNIKAVHSHFLNCCDCLLPAAALLVLLWKTGLRCMLWWYPWKSEEVRAASSPLPLSLVFVITDVGVSLSRRATWWSSGKNVGQATQIFSLCFVNKVSTQLRCLICCWMSANDLKVKLNSTVKQSVQKDTWTSHRAKHSPEVSPAVCKTAKIGSDVKS